MRAPCKQAASIRNGELPSVFRKGARTDSAARHPGPGKYCDANLFGSAKGKKANQRICGISVWSWRKLRTGRRTASIICFVSSQPTEYVYWQAHGIDDGGSAACNPGVSGRHVSGFNKQMARLFDSAL